jgi:ribonucleoside-diphosphate reductase alpha chain
MICHAAYRQSVSLAEEKGGFPALERERYLDAPFIQRLPADIRDGIARHGIRNSHLLAIAPTGTISLLAGNVSGGIEPVFAPDYQRTVLDAKGEATCFPLTDYAVRLWRERSGRGEGVPDALVSAAHVPIEGHLAMQAALQDWVDHSISKTIHVPTETSFDEFKSVYQRAYDKGLKGCTTFRPMAGTEVVLAPVQQQAPTCRVAGTCE